MIKCPPSARLSTCACSGIGRRNAQIQPLVRLSSPFPNNFCLNTSNHILMQNRTLKQTRTGVIPSCQFAFNANVICAKILRRVAYKRQAEVFVSHFKSNCVCFWQWPGDEVLPIDVAQRRRFLQIQAKDARIGPLAAQKTPCVVFSVADEAIFEMFPCYEFALRNSLQGLLRELNPGPVGPKPRIMPLDQAAM